MRKVGWVVAIVIGFGALAGCGGSLQTSRTNQASTYKCLSYNANERCKIL